jgi:hypothetical protein
MRGNVAGGGGLSTPFVVATGHRISQAWNLFISNAEHDSGLTTGR